MKALWMLLAAVIVWGCATNPATGQRQIILMSEQEEIQLGRQSDAEVRQQMGLYQDPALQQYIRGIGARLARQAHRPNLPWTFAVVDEPAVNAFALPGGFVYITRGILPFLRNEAELAAVMGHEVGHVDARHSAQQYSTQTLAGGGLAVLGIFVPQTRPAQGLASAGLNAMFLKFSREDELQADQLGVGYASKAGWDPQGMPGLLGTLARLDSATGSSRGVPNWALTHPPAADRVAKVQAAVAAVPAGGTTNPTTLEQHIDGLVFGDSREKGIVRGTEFLHPILRFAVRFPDGWDVQNGEEQVVAQPAGQTNRVMLLQVTDASGALSQLASQQTTQAGWRPAAGDVARINGLDAYVGTYDGVVDQTAVRLRAAHVRSGSHVFVIAGLAPTAEFAAAEPVFAAAIRTFRSLSAEEANRIQPDRVDFHVVRNGETWDSLAREAGGAVKASTLAIMNGRDPGSAPRAGERVRVVVAE
jgi:predicted Zn-dependent protease